MKQVCLLCERMAADGNLFCQEIYCPTEKSPTILGQGDWLGDIEIVKVVVVSRTATLYEAMQQKQKVFLKVAHPGPVHKLRIQREAELFNQLQGNLTYGHLLPKLLAPYANTTLKRDVIGKSMVGEHLLYFLLFAYIEAEPLRDLLLQNSQRWIQHVGWIAQQLTMVTGFLHSRHFVHFGLRPECLLIRFDQENIPRLLLIDLGIAAPLQDFELSWVAAIVPPAYTAPELLGPYDRPDIRTDVYGVGQLLYELLVGQAMYTHRLQSDSEVIAAIRDQKSVRMNRMEDVPDITKITLDAVAGIHEFENRPKDMRALGKQLQKIFGNVPAEKTSRWPKRRTLYVIGGAILMITILILLAIWLPMGN